MKEKPLWEIFPDIVKKVRQDHIDKNALIESSHNFLHALMVAQYAKIIANDENTGIAAWVAGIIHNTDRLFSEQKVLERLKYYLETPDSSCLYFRLHDSDQEDIIEAVLNHSNLNDPNDSPVTITLKDADRLANIGANMPVRSGQHYHNLPDYDPRYVKNSDPEATYRNPKTCLHDIKCALEWKSMLRLPKAKKLAKPWFKQLQIFIKGFAKQLKDVDLYPYPFAEDYAVLLGKNNL